MNYVPRWIVGEGKLQPGGPNEYPDAQDVVVAAEAAGAEASDSTLAAVTTTAAAAHAVFGFVRSGMAAPRCAAREIRA